MMVSTRGVKLKFYEGERVLCYEPDPTKAKVLYDSKVLDVIINKDLRGRRSIEYLIHFQGWNSSWDRCVGEEYVLKDTPENRQLQKDLAEKSQLHLGAYLYRKERKKNRKPEGLDGGRAGASSEDGSSGSPARMDMDDGPEGTSSSELNQEIREILENDHAMITKNKLHKLPAEPNIITILEMFWKHFASNQIFGLNEKPNSRNRNNNNANKAKPEDIQKNLTIGKEFVDGIRIYFDAISVEHLLYPSEKGQVKTTLAVYQSPVNSLKNKFKSENYDSHNNHQCLEDMNKNGSLHHHDEVNSRRRTLRSNHKQETQTNGNEPVEVLPPVVNVKPSASIASSNSDATGPLTKALAWQLLPEHVYLQQPPPPSLVYGATHLLRLFVKLPMFLSCSSLTDAKLKVILRNVESLLDFLAEHKEWYDDKFYVDTPIHRD
ncbi:unnamed protein product [Brassicogethes aeneus]|uniref:Protein male-specific lethal-3 n=1 Tax=Brassicogethes aeneus TaxID=1431903 RepID=A0A9P0B2L8_BRAAE|nr:unnamed protein product [Brassicogethes aeneus]